MMALLAETTYGDYERVGKKRMSEAETHTHTYLNKKKHQNLLIIFFSLQENVSLAFPLVTLISYRGYTLMASSRLPIASSSKKGNFL